VITALPCWHYSRHYKARKEEGGQGIPGKETWRKKRGWHASDPGRWRQHHKTELD